MSPEKRGRPYRSSRSEKAEGGFTLIEVLVAAGLTAVLVAALYSTFFSVSGASSRAQRTMDGYLEAGYFLDRFSREVRSAHYRRTDRLSFFNGGRQGEQWAVTFTTVTHPAASREAPSGDLAAVNYHVREKDGRKDLVKEVWSPFRAERYSVEAIEDIRRFEVRFFNGKDWSGAWDGALEGQLPRAVEVKVTLSTGEELAARARTMIR